MYSSISAGRVEVGVDVVDALHQLLEAAAHRAEVDADRAVLECRLHDHRELDVVGVLDAARASTVVNYGVWMPWNAKIFFASALSCAR